MTTPLATQEKTMTAEEFWPIACKDGFRGELVQGKVVEMVPPCYEHGEIVGNVFKALINFVEAHHLGKVIGEVGFILGRNPDTVRAPDLAFVRAERPGPAVKKRFSEIPPDLAVEVISPSETYAGVMERTRMYLSAGVEEVWIIDPDNKSVEIRRTLDEVRVFQQDKTLESALFPGLRLPVAKLFE